MARSPNLRPSSATPFNSVRIKAVPLAPPIHVKFLGALRGILTHWAKGHSVPCDGDAKCPPALHRSGVFFKAYAPAEWWISHEQVWRPAVLEATSNLEEILRGRKLRGETWLLSREKEADKSSAVCAAYCETIAESLLSPTFDILPVLQRVFNRLDLVLDVANPTPRRVILPDAAGAPPIIPADLQPPPPLAEDPAERGRMKELLEQARHKFGLPRSVGDRKSVV